MRQHQVAGQNGGQQYRYGNQNDGGKQRGGVSGARRGVHRQGYRQAAPVETAGSQRFGHQSGRAGKHPQQAGQHKQAPGHDQRKGNGVIRRQPRGKAHKQSGGQPPQRRLQQKIPAAQVLQAEAAVPQPRDAVQQPVHQPGQGGSPHRKALGKGDMLGAGQAAHRRGKNVRQQHLQEYHHQRGRQAVPHHAGQLLDQRPDKGRLPQAPQVQVQHPGGPAQQQQQVKDDRGRQ